MPNTMLGTRHTIMSKCQRQSWTLVKMARLDFNQEHITAIVKRVKQEQSQLLFA